MSHSSTHKFALAVLAALLLTLAVPGWAGQVQVYTQGPNYNGLYASQNDTAGFGLFAQSYDNFKLGSATTITQASWVGGYYNRQSLAPSLAGPLAFMLTAPVNLAGKSPALHSLVTAVRPSCRTTAWEIRFTPTPLD